MNALQIKQITEEAQRQQYAAKEAEAQKKAKEELDRQNDWVEGRRALIPEYIADLKQKMVEAAKEGKRSIRVELATSYPTHSYYRKDLDPMYHAYVDYAKENGFGWNYDSETDYELGWEMERTDRVHCYEHYMEFKW